MREHGLNIDGWSLSHARNMLTFHKVFGMCVSGHGEKCRHTVIPPQSMVSLRSLNSSQLSRVMELGRYDHRIAEVGRGPKRWNSANCDHRIAQKKTGKQVASLPKTGKCHICECVIIAEASY